MRRGALLLVCLVAAGALSVKQGLALAGEGAYATPRVEVAPQADVKPAVDPSGGGAAKGEGATNGSLADDRGAAVADSADGGMAKSEGATNGSLADDRGAAATGPSGGGAAAGEGAQASRPTDDRGAASLSAAPAPGTPGAAAPLVSALETTPAAGSEEQATPSAARVVRAATPRHRSFLQSAYYGFRWELFSLPDLHAASFVFAPFSWLEGHFGVTTDLFSAGIKGGVTFRSPTRPSIGLVLEGGQQFDGDANGLIGRLTGDASFHHEVVERLGYRYGTGDLCLGAGTKGRKFTFLLCGGVTVVNTTLHQFQTLVQGQSSGSTVTSSDPSVTTLIPSIKLGLECLWRGSRS